MTEIREEIKSDEEVTQQLMKINDNSSKNEPPTAEIHPLWFSRRFLAVLLASLGSFFVVGIKVCINIAVIEMTKNKNITVDNVIILQPAEFKWDNNLKGLVQGCFNFGYFFASFGGYLATRFGGSVTYGVATAIESILTILNPMAMELGNIYGFIACRTVTGLFDSIAYASTAEFYSRWVPANERSRSMAIIFTGIYISIAVSYFIFGYIARFFGWKMLFYVTGSSTLIWSIIWLIVVRNEPSKDKFISEKELLYIVNNTVSTPRNEIVHPYRKIYTSPAVLALCVAKFTYGWGFSMIVVGVPLYINDVTHKKIDEIGVISSIPNIACIFMTPVVGAIMDFLQNNTSLKPNQIHKMLMTLGFVSSSILFVIIAFSSNFTLSMACFVLIKLFLSFNFLILQLICLYMAPKHSSVLLGFSAIWYVHSFAVVPSTIGFIVEKNRLEESWSTCFQLSAVVLLIGAIVYFIFGSSELQSWANLIGLYMAPKHSSVLLGFSGIWWVTSMIVVPSTIGFIVANNSLQEWSTCFQLNALILMIGSILYLIYGSSALQPWAM